MELPGARMLASSVSSVKSSAVARRSRAPRRIMGNRVCSSSVTLTCAPATRQRAGSAIRREAITTNFGLRATPQSYSPFSYPAGSRPVVDPNA